MTEKDYADALAEINRLIDIDNGDGLTVEESLRLWQLVEAVDEYDEGWLE